MNTNGSTKNKFISIFKKRGIYLCLVAVCVIGLSVWGLWGISGQIDESQLTFLQNAIRRSAVQCYAIEGSFPRDISYLEDHYGLTLDRDRFIFHYEYRWGNQVPRINVYVKP